MKKIIISAIALAVLLFISISIWPMASGVVFDSVTGKPVPGVMVERKLRWAGIGWESNPVFERTIKTITDKNGKFSFYPSIKFKFFIFGFDGETIKVNHPYLLTDAQKLSINNKYFFYANSCLNNQYSSKKCGGIFYSNNKKILLAPKVEKSIDCADNLLCLEMNAQYLILKENNLNICGKLSDTDGYRTDMEYNFAVRAGVRHDCYLMYAAHYKNTSVCNLFFDKKCLDYASKKYNGCGQLFLDRETYLDDRVTEALCQSSGE